jgi:MYXO-CTERM domain-containing protein
MASRLTEEEAGACGGGMVAPIAAFPAPGATDVPLETAIVVRSGSEGMPGGLNLLVNGSAVPLPASLPLGHGLTPEGHAWFFQLAGRLMPSTSYALVIASPNPDASGAATVELTHFSTSADYDKTPGSGATINDLRLWRGHYPKSQVGAGGCVSAEYEGYFALDFTAGTVRGTPPEDVISILRLESSETRLIQSLVFMGLDKLPGGFEEDRGGNIPLPGGGSLSVDALWKPVLEAGGTTCAWIEIAGRNDTYTAPFASNSVCVPVTSVDSPDLTQGAGGAGGASAPGGVGTAGGNSGCSVVPARGGGALVVAMLALVARRRRRR